MRPGTVIVNRVIHILGIRSGRSAGVLPTLLTSDVGGGPLANQDRLSIPS
jgi:hypothetical protein